MNKKEFIIENIQKILNQVKDKLTIEDVIEIEECLEYNEWGIAYETLCTQLYEYESPISQEVYDNLAILGPLTKYHSNVWSPLKELIKK